MWPAIVCVTMPNICKTLNKRQKKNNIDGLLLWAECEQSAELVISSYMACIRFAVMLTHCFITINGHITVVLTF